MKFTLRLNADEIKDALNDAEGEGVEDLSLIIVGSVDKNQKSKVDKMYLYGECTTEYLKNII